MRRERRSILDLWGIFETGTVALWEEGGWWVGSNFWQNVEHSYICSITFHVVGLWHKLGREEEEVNNNGHPHIIFLRTCTTAMEESWSVRSSQFQVSSLFKFLQVHPSNYVFSLPTKLIQKPLGDGPRWSICDKHHKYSTIYHFQYKILISWPGLINNQDIFIYWTLCE